MVILASSPLTAPELGSDQNMAKKPFYHRHKLRFECTGCGICCTGSPQDYVAVDRAEQEQIRNWLGISKKWFRHRYILRVDQHTEGLASAKSGSCVFLDQAMRCRIYPVRPRQCRAYPFWPEVLRNRWSWRAEALRCEGIGRGALVPLRRIESALKATRR